MSCAGAIMNLVMNEYKYAENLVNKENLSIEDIGTKPSRTLNILARYYREIGKDDDTIKRLLLDFLQRCLQDNYKESRWIDSVFRQVKYSRKYGLKRVDGIHITKSEIDTIQLVKGKRKQKVLFTLLVIAKYYNAVSENNNNWANTDYRKVFSLANVQITTQDQGLMINELYRNNLINLSRNVGKPNRQVNFIDDKADVVLTITQLKDLGNEYLLYCGENYVHCERCGAVVRKSRNGKTRYCKKCSEIVNKEKTRERMSRIRKQNV